MQMKNVNYFRAWPKKANCARTPNSSNMNMNTNVNMSTLDKIKGEERERKRESDYRAKADVVNFELFLFLQPAFNICLQLVKWTRNCGKYFSQNYKKKWQKKTNITRQQNAEHI